jgi:hypothetical protein
MKISVRKMLVLLAIVLSFTTIQAVWARSCNVTVTGIITEFNIADNSITISSGSGDDTTTVYGIPFTYLANKLKIVLKVDDSVVITAYQCLSTDKLSACSLSVNGGSVITFPRR